MRDQARNHNQSKNANRNSEYDEEELDRTEDELDYEDQEQYDTNVSFVNQQQHHRQRQNANRRGLLKTASINKSASTSSIHTAHLSPHVSSNTKTVTPVTAPLNRSREFEDHRQNPPVSNRSQVIKNQHQTSEQAVKLKSCNIASGHTVFSSSAIKSPHGIKEGPLINKNIHNNHLNNQKVLSKSPCSVNSLFTATNKNHMFLTKESPKKQKSKVQKILETQTKEQIKQTSKAINSDIIVNGGTQNHVVKPDFDVSKRKYLVGLNLFNRKPEKGINYLIEEKFLDPSSKNIAEFLFNRNCLSKQIIGDYISNTQDKFIFQVLNDFIQMIDLRALPVDEALRKFQTHFRMPGESQKIEHLINVFALRYIECNQIECESFFNCADETINVLSYAIILLNTSIHNPNVKANERMKFEQFCKYLI